jgi:cyclic pyranopterin phosphate synthase
VQNRRSLAVYEAPPPRTVRVSLTDRCDLACVYCRPSRSDGYLEERLDDAGWRTMIAGLLGAGIRRVRITGGEPLLHPRVVDMVRYVASLGVDDLALTTNATRLAGLALPLREAGLRRITVSIDSLDPERFRRITRGGDLRRVLAGVDAALGAGFEEIKINCVVLRGENDDELVALTEWAWALGITPRFIEIMAIGEGANLAVSHLVTAAEMRERLQALLTPELAKVDPDRGPAKYVHALRDRRLRVGFITGTSDTFCASCDRLRVTADGTLRPCLATNDGVSGKAAAQSGQTEAVAEAIRLAWQQKPDGSTWNGCTEDTAAQVSMRATGG